MRKQEPANGNRDAAPAAVENGHHFPQVDRVTVLPSNAVVQENADGVDVVVTTPGRGTILIRRRSGDHSWSRCPLLRYEIRRIDEVVPRQDGPSRAAPRIGSTSEEGTGRRAPPEAWVVDAPRHPHWSFALQLAGEPRLNLAPRETE